jgi:hypothetical protein
MSFWRSAWTRLFVSHALAGLLGVAAGVAYTTKTSPSRQAVYHAFERRPLLDAANVAFRFGSPEHSRATLESLLRIPASNELDWSDTMMAELRLAILDRELAPGSTGSPHLDRARAACQRLRGPDCAPGALRALAVKLAHQRH